MDKLDQLFVLIPFIKTIQEGKFFNKVFAWLLRIIAVLLVILFFYGSFKMWQIFSISPAVKLFFGFFFIQIFFAALIYVSINILYSRSNDIDTMPMNTDYIVIPIFVTVIKLVGEMLATVYAIGGLTVGFAMFFMGNFPVKVPLLSSLSYGGGIVGGLLAILFGAVIGILFLILFYFIAEQVGVFVDIARNTRK